MNVIPIDNNECAFSVAVVPFTARNNELHLVVGTAQDTCLAPRSCTSGFLRTYTFTNDGAGLELLHKVCSLLEARDLSFLTRLSQTETDDVPMAVLGFQGRLVAGVGKALRIYDMGKKKLLRKVENKVIQPQYARSKFAHACKHRTSAPQSSPSIRRAPAS